MGDLEQLARGGVNGLISASQRIARTAARAAVDRLAGPVAPLVSPLISPHVEQPIDKLNDYRLPIDPRYGGAGIMGEELAENLIFEALPLAPKLGRAARSSRARFIRTTVGELAAETRIARAQEMYDLRKAQAEDFVLERTRLEKPKSGWHQSEVQAHLRRLSESGNAEATTMLNRFNEAIRALAEHPPPLGREIFWDPRWLRPPY